MAAVAEALSFQLTALNDSSNLETLRHGLIPEQVQSNAEKRAGDNSKNCRPSQILKYIRAHFF